MNHVEQLITIFSTAAEAARRVGVGKQAISNWRARGYIPAAHALVVEQVTRKKIRAVEIIRVWEERERNREKGRRGR